jgi:hypothetical protein
MSEKTIRLGTTVLSFAIGIVGLIILLIILSSDDNSPSQLGAIDTGIRLSMYTMIAAAALALIFGISQFVGNIKGNMSVLIGVVAFVILGFISYALATSEVLPAYGSISETTSRLSGAGLFFTYILLITAALTAILGEVLRLFK